MFLRDPASVPKRPVRPVGAARTAVPGLCLKLYCKSVRPLGGATVEEGDCRALQSSPDR